MVMAGSGFESAQPMRIQRSRGAQLNAIFLFLVLTLLLRWVDRHPNIDMDFSLYIEADYRILSANNTSITVALYVQ